MLEARHHEGGASGNYWIYWIAGALLIALPIIGGFGSFTCMDNGYLYLAVVGFLQALILAGAVGVRFLSEEGVERIDKKWDSLVRLSDINGCVDELTNIPLEAITHEFEIG